MDEVRILACQLLAQGDDVFQGHAGDLNPRQAAPIRALETVYRRPLVLLRHSEVQGEAGELDAGAAGRDELLHVLRREVQRQALAALGHDSRTGDEGRQVEDLETIRERLR